MEKRVLRIALGLILAMSALFACTSKPTGEVDLVATSVQETVTAQAALASPTPFPTPEPTVLPSPTAPAIPQNRPHYNLEVSLNYYSHVADVAETITYTNRSGSPLPELVIAIPPKNYPDCYVQKMLTGPSVQGFTEDGQITRIALSQPLANGEQTQIHIEYRLIFPEIPGIFGVSHRQTNMFNWYPYIPVYENGQFIVHPMAVYQESSIGEYVFNEISDFDVHLKLTDRAELIEIAASAPAIGEPKSGDYRYHLELVRAFSLSACDSYFENEITHNGVRIHVYMFFNEVETGKRIMEIVAKALDVYGELWMPYPREMISVVAGDFLHNMEADGMVMISYGVIDNAKKERQSMLDYLVPHEISHQWFYSLVGNDQAIEPWLDEALATYNESLFYEKTYPDLAAWWWTSRVDSHALSGAVNSQIYIDGGYDAYRNAVYLRGAQFLREIRQAMGDEAFFSALKTYFLDHLYGIGKAEDLLARLKASSPVDLDPIIANYFSG